MGIKNARLFERILDLPNKSFILLGPRGTGKSTLIKHKLKTALEINLLRSSEFIPLSQNPSLLREKVSHLKAGDWVFIDEIQKIPALLDEVHDLYEDLKLNFALSGSSARKLKRGGANLLAGRALSISLYPLVYTEYQNEITLQEAVDWGTLPGIVVDRENAKESLSSYVETYLRQELIEEGLIRKLDPFVRFLSVAGQYNAQILNVENIAREAHISRSTIDKYFDVLEETLIGSRLPPIRLGLSKKEITHPKFYFFDQGVARACAGLASEEIDNVWRGFAFETLVVNEIKAYNKYNKLNKDLFYYKVSGGTEIDLIIEIGKKTLSKPRALIAIEIKFSKKWDSRWSQNLSSIQQECGLIKKTIGIYMGNEILTQKNVTIYPFKDFIKTLYNQKIF